MNTITPSANDPQTSSMSSIVASDFWKTPPKQRLKVLASRPLVTRVAPSPTGHMHLGTLRTALHNFILAKASGGQFILRIDDTDKARNNANDIDLIQHSLQHCGLQWDDLFLQSDRFAKHALTAQALVDAGLAYLDGTAVRLHPSAIDPNFTQFFDAANGVCVVSTTIHKQIQDTVLLRSDGIPTYHFASVLDDIDSGVNCIVRGADHLSNTAKHITIAQTLAAIGYPQAQQFVNNIVVAHVGLITTKKVKLSKRDNDSNLQMYMQNYTMAALLQWAFQLGWGHTDALFDKNTPLVSLADMPSVFLDGALRGSNCNMDLMKLQSLNKKWLHAQKNMLPI